MANRGARLAELDRFHARIRRQAEAICRVEPCPIAAPETTVADLILDLIAIIQTLDINDNHTPVVVGSKALHHLLPDLIPPIDRAYTGRFFAWPKSSFQARPRGILREALTVYTQWARPCRPDRLVGA